MLNASAAWRELPGDTKAVPCEASKIYFGSSTTQTPPEAAPFDRDPQAAAAMAASYFVSLGSNVANVAANRITEAFGSMACSPSLPKGFQPITAAGGMFSATAVALSDEPGQKWTDLADPKVGTGNASGAADFVVLALARAQNRQNPVTKEVRSTPEIITNAPVALIGEIDCATTPNIPKLSL